MPYIHTYYITPLRYDISATPSSLLYYIIRYYIHAAIHIRYIRYEILLTLLDTYAIYWPHVTLMAIDVSPPSHWSHTPQPAITLRYYAAEGR